jgi:lipopolysaccharide export system protein LptC
MRALIVVLLLAALFMFAHFAVMERSNAQPVRLEMGSP